MLSTRPRPSMHHIIIIENVNTVILSDYRNPQYKCMLISSTMIFSRTNLINRAHRTPHTAHRTPHSPQIGCTACFSNLVYSVDTGTPTRFVSARVHSVYCRGMARTVWHYSIGAAMEVKPWRERRAKLWQRLVALVLRPL